MLKDKKVENSLKILIRQYYDYSNERIAMDGRLGIKKDGELKKKTPDRDEIMLAYLYTRRKEIITVEKEIEKEIRKEVNIHTLWKGFFEDVIGVGPIMAAVIITEFDIKKANTVSKLWAFAGINPGIVFGKTGKLGNIKTSNILIRQDKKTKGFLCPYNQFLKCRLLGVLAGSFLKASSPYSKFYYDYRFRLVSLTDEEKEKRGLCKSKNPTDKNKPYASHINNRAKRYMIKMFLKDLYVAWRTLEGLPVRDPYADEYLNRKHAG